MPGDVIIHDGVIGEEMYIIGDGQVCGPITSLP